MAAEYARALARRHPLQRLEAPSRGSSALLHLLGLSSFAYSFAYLILNPDPVSESYGWHLQYLTIIGLSLAAVTFAVGLLADLTMSSRLFAVKNLLSVASAPMECLISMLYWGLRAIDPKLVLPSWQPPLPVSVDLSFHAVPALALVADLLFFSPPYTVAFLPAFGLSSCIAFGYWLWIERCYHYNRFYPYPLFTVLDTTQRIGLFASSALLMALSTAALVWVYHVVNGKEEIALANGHARAPEERDGDVKGK
ncbi:hypothetical protein LTR74_003499 [Friedmanniomyces endolithicus]|nr:hypothetical protein LTR74_003499 [Friedmanniomyces endolithicus]